eukprot:scaffold185181_cov26-Tisochrysis_lutea.AAC.1
MTPEREREPLHLSLSLSGGERSRGVLLLARCNQHHDGGSAEDVGYFHKVETVTRQFFWIDSAPTATTLSPPVVALIARATSRW